MLEKKRLVLVAAAFCLAAVPAFGQRSHGNGAAGGSHGPAMNNGAADHGNSGSAKSVEASSPATLLTNNTRLNTKLTAKLQAKGLLPAGTELKDACSGFKNLGQCMAAIHVSHNLDVPFACMKESMTGIAPAKGTTCPAAATSSGKMSLGKSIQALSPNANSKTEEKSAKAQADADIKEAQSESQG